MNMGSVNLDELKKKNSVNIINSGNNASSPINNIEKPEIQYIKKSPSKNNVGSYENNIARVDDKYRRLSPKQNEKPKKVNSNVLLPSLNNNNSNNNNIVKLQNDKYNYHSVEK